MQRHRRNSDVGYRELREDRRNFGLGPNLFLHVAAMALQQKLPSSDSGLRPTSSAEKRIVTTVFRRHYDQLAGGVVNPDRLTTLLYAKGLISTGTRDEVLTTQSLPRTQKVVKILNAVEAMLLTHHRPGVALKEFCRAVKNQPALKPVAKDIRSELGEWKFTTKYKFNSFTTVFLHHSASQCTEFKQYTCILNYRLIPGSPTRREHGNILALMYA